MGEAPQFLLLQGGVPEAQDSCVGAFSGSEGLCRYRRGSGFGCDAGDERAKSETASSGAGDRPAEPAALATVVEKELCAERFLESPTGVVPASDCRGAVDVGFGGSLRRLANQWFGEPDEVSFSDHNEFLPGGSGYVMVFVLPQKMPLDCVARAVIEQWASYRGGLQDATGTGRVGKRGEVGAFSVQRDRAAFGRPA